MKVVTAALLFVCLTNSPAWTQSGTPSSSREIAAYGGPDRERLLFEGAKREGKLVWYTTLAAVQNKQIAATFEAKYPGVRVEAYRAGSSALVQRLINAGGRYLKCLSWYDNEWGYSNRVCDLLGLIARWEKRE